MVVIFPLVMNEIGISFKKENIINHNMLLNGKKCGINGMQSSSYIIQTIISYKKEWKEYTYTSQLIDECVLETERNRWQKK